MSSATSIDRAPRDVPAARPAERDSLRPWHFFVLASLLAATTAVVLGGRTRPEHLVLISITIGAAGFAAAALYRTLAPLVSPEVAMAPGQLTESRRAVLEREKQLALRAIKELEFDRAMGKLSPKDFEEMAGRLRTRAMSLMRELDAGSAGYQDLIERELTSRLRNAPAGRGKAAKAAAKGDARTCACGTANDRDAAFCKRCGARLAEAVD